MRWSVAVTQLLITTGAHMPTGSRYMLPGRDDIPAFTPGNQSWYSIQQFQRNARLSYQ